jgi:L-threonylcarbamoyladenylate synthase
MKLFTSVNDPQIVRILNAGGIGIIRTDTLYGLVGRADDQSAVQRIYDLKHRDEAKSPIVLIGLPSQVYDEPNEQAKRVIAGSWPGKVSLILPSENAPEWIRRGNASVAYRLPDDVELRQLLRNTGPLVAPSANPEGEEPAMNIDQAAAYFGSGVDFYIDGGEVTDATPSQLIRVNSDGHTERLR